MKKIKEINIKLKATFSVTIRKVFNDYSKDKRYIFKKDYAFSKFAFKNKHKNMILGWSNGYDAWGFGYNGKEGDPIHKLKKILFKLI